MRILSIGNFTTGWDGSICDEEHVAGALEELGHRVWRWQREDPGSSIWVDPDSPLDFVLIAQWDGYGDKLDTLRDRFSCPVVYWAFDYQADGQEWHERLVAEADLYLSKRIADSKYPNWRWLSQDFAPKFLDRHPDYHQTHNDTVDIVFTGSYLPWATERNETLKAVDDKFDLHIYTVTPNEWSQLGFKNVHGPKMDQELPFVVHQAKIVLSIDHTIEAGYWSDRPAQTMCCGGFVLHRYQPLSETVFRDNIAYFYSEEDCIKQIEYYLENNKVRELISENGYTYAQKYLKVENRVRDLLTIVRDIL